MARKTETCGDVVRRLREAKGLTPEELGERAGLHPMTVRKLETGQRGWPRLDTAARLAAGLGVGIDQLVPAGTVVSVPA